MNPLKQRTPGCDPGHGGKNSFYGRLENIQKYKASQPVCCLQCAFHELIPLRGGHNRQLCHFTGEKNPLPGQYGCHFLPGQWDAERINYLTPHEVKGRLGFPNLVRPCNGLDHSQDGQKVARHSTAIHAYADINGNRALHIGRAQRPHDREAAAASLRPGSVGALPFCF